MKSSILNDTSTSSKALGSNFPKCLAEYYTYTKNDQYGGSLVPCIRHQAGLSQGFVLARCSSWMHLWPPQSVRIFLVCPPPKIWRTAPRIWAELMRCPNSGTRELPLGPSGPFGSPRLTSFCSLLGPAWPCSLLDSSLRNTSDRFLGGHAGWAAAMENRKKHPVLGSSWTALRSSM